MTPVDVAAGLVLLRYLKEGGFDLVAFYHRATVPVEHWRILTGSDHHHAALMLRELVRSAAAVRLDPHRLAALSQRWESVWSLLLANPLGACH